MVRKKYKLIVIAAMIVVAAMALIFGIGGLTASASDSPSGHKWQIVPIEELIITAEGGTTTATGRIELHLGETARLDVLLTPDYAIYTAEKPQYKIIDGTNLATVDNKEGTLTVNVDADKHAGAEVRVIAVVDGVTSKNTLTFNIIKTPMEIETDVEWVDIIPILAIVNEEQEYAISELLQIYIVGNNIEEPEYTQYESKKNTFVRIDNLKGTLYIDPGSDFNNRFFYLRATVEGVTSNYLRFEIYVKTKTLEADLVNELPMSSKEKGDTVFINVKVDERATTQIPEIRVVEGWNLIAGNYNCGDLVKNQFDLKPNVASLGEKFIKLKVDQDGRPTKYVDIEIYIPVEEVSFNNRSIVIDGKTYYYINRLDTNILSPIFTPNAYLTSKEDWKISNKGIADVFNLYQIKIPQNTPAGTKIAVTYQSKDLLHTEFTSYFIVEEFSEDVIKNKLSVAYGYDSGKDGIKVQINNNDPQLWVGRSAEVLITIFGDNLSNFGLSVSDKNLFKNSIAETGKKNDNEAWIKIEPNASGKDVISNAYIIIKDGDTVTYKIMLPKLSVFKPLSGTPVLEGATTAMTEKTKDFKLIGGIGWVYDATYSLDNLVITASTLNVGTTFLNNRLTITNASAGASQIFTISCVQKYNGTDELFLDSNRANFTVTQLVKRITLYRNYDNNDYNTITTVLAVDGFNRTTTPPTRTGYDFTGYRRYRDSGTLYYNKEGVFVGEHSSSPYSDCTTLYAQWSQQSLTFYACYEYGRSGDNVYYERLQYIYVYYGSGDYSVSVEAPTRSGYIFKEWRKYSLIPEYLGSVWSYNEDSSIRDPYKRIGLRDRTIITSNRLTFNPSDRGIKEGIVTYIAFYEIEDTCVAEGTLITLADGTQKPVEQLNGNELLLVWNLHTGKFDVAPILFIDSDPAREYEIIHLYFSDGTNVKVIFEHAFWDFDLNQYVFLRNDAAKYIGHWFNKQIIDDDGNLSWFKVQLTDVQIYTEYTTAWSPVTFGHLCYYINGMLSMPGATEGLINIFEVDGEIMQINQEKFLCDIEIYGLLTYEYFEDLIPEIMFEAFQGQYLAVSMGKDLLTEEQLIKLIERYSKFLILEEYDL